MFTLKEWLIFLVQDILTFSVIVAIAFVPWILLFYFGII